MLQGPCYRLCLLVHRGSARDKQLRFVWIRLPQSNKTPTTSQQRSLSWSSVSWNLICQNSTERQLQSIGKVQDASMSSCRWEETRRSTTIGLGNPHVWYICWKSLVLSFTMILSVCIMHFINSCRQPEDKEGRDMEGTAGPEYMGDHAMSGPGRMLKGAGGISWSLRP